MLSSRERSNVRSFATCVWVAWTASPIFMLGNYAACHGRAYLTLRRWPVVTRNTLVMLRGKLLYSDELILDIPDSCARPFSVMEIPACQNARGSWSA